MEAVKQNITIFVNNDGTNTVPCILININGVVHSACDFREIFSDRSKIEVVTSGNSIASDNMSMHKVMMDCMRAGVVTEKIVEVEITEQHNEHYVYTTISSPELKKYKF